MTIDRRTGLAASRIAACAVAALGVWFMGVAILTVVVEPTRTVVIFGRSAQAVVDAVTGADVAMLGGSGRVLTVAGASPGFVRKLYASGAWLVLPFSGGGCRGAARRS
jgi:hypothetical protein